MRWLALVGLVAGSTLVGVALPAVDHTREARTIDNALLFLPSGRQLHLVSSGQAEVLADLLWVKAVLTFGERWERTSDTTWVTWLERMVETVNTLDPHWRTPYFYGGMVLRVVDRIDASDAVFRRGADALPDDWFFPFSMGMNAYLYRDDTAEAARWVERAAPLPEAPLWLPALAAEFRQRSGDRSNAIAYLEEVKARTTLPEVRADADRQLARLHHNGLVDAWAPACRDFRAQVGRPLASVEEFERVFGRALPANPRGGDWIVGRDGVVRDAVAERERRNRRLRDEWSYLR